jgi:hypothetical protein
VSGPTVARTLCAWAPGTTPAVALRVAKRALLDIGLCEIPPGSNRSPRIDEYVSAVGSPPGSFWCAAAVAAWFREAGAMLPPSSAGSCDVWMGWAKFRGLWRVNPAIGDAVVYGTPTDATHIGVVVRVTPLELAVEGNTALEQYSRNGVAVDLKLVNPARVVGYVRASEA